MRWTWKQIGHLGLDENLGTKRVNANITVDSVRNVLDLAEKFLNFALRDQNPDNYFLPKYYQPIKEEKSTETFLGRLSTSVYPKEK